MGSIPARPLRFKLHGGSWTVSLFKVHPCEKHKWLVSRGRVAGSSFFSHARTFKAHLFSIFIRFPSVRPKHQLRHYPSIRHQGYLVLTELLVRVPQTANIIQMRVISIWPVDFLLPPTIFSSTAPFGYATASSLKTCKSKHEINAGYARTPLSVCCVEHK